MKKQIIHKYLMEPFTGPDVLVITRLREERRLLMDNHTTLLWVSATSSFPNLVSE